MDEFLEYRVYLAKRKLLESFIGSGAVLCTLSRPNVKLITESLNSTVEEYINKVLTSAQTQWDKYKKTVGSEKDRNFLKKEANAIKVANPNFTINDFPTYKIDFLNTIKIQPFNYELMKDSLSSKQAYIDKYYSNLKVNGKSNIKEGLRALCFQEPTTIKCDRKVLIASYNFCNTNFYNHRNIIEGDFKTINNSANSINTALTTVQMANEAVNVYKEFSTKHRTDIITEAPTTPNGNSDTKSMSFSDNGGDKTNMNDQKTQKKNQSFLKAVNIYMDVSLTIISTKMKLLQEIYNANMNVIKYYVEWSSKGKKETPLNNNAQTMKKQIDL